MDVSKTLSWSAPMCLRRFSCVRVAEFGLFLFAITVPGAEQRHTRRSARVEVATEDASDSVELMK